MDDYEVLIDLKVPDPAMFDDYDVGGHWSPPPQAKYVVNGRLGYIPYTATMPDADKYTFKPDRNGFLMLVIDGIVLEGGHVLRKTYLSSAPFPKRNKAGEITGTRNASALGNFFRSFALVVRPATPEEYEAFALSTAGMDCQVTIDWEAYDSDTQTTAATTWDQFPEDPEHPGQKLSYLEQGDKRLWARASIKRFVDAVKG